jgi:hypothetical protein
MSYGRVHRAFFDSSISDSDVVTRFVFVAMIVLSDLEGRIDITRSALARRINVSDADVDKAIELLSQPDPLSRTPDHDGRRIVPIDAGRSWGWIVANKEQYREGEADSDELRRQARERKRRQRERDRSQGPECLSSFTDTSSTNITTTLSSSVTGHATSRGVTLASREKCDVIFARCWSIVPRKEGRKDARRHFDAEVTTLARTTPADQLDVAIDNLGADLERAIRNYSEQTAIDRIEPRYLMQGRKLFFNFRDYVEKRPMRTSASERREGPSGVAL